MTTRWLDTLQAADVADRCPEPTRRWLRSGKLRAYPTRHNNRMYFHLGDVQAVVQKAEIEA